ncbi:MAG TPA: GNAT family N-acetyltransferase [Candidatus Saccharimonadia bacterium]|nr:GNAT family N-acetyltransferase [Candidatus Saccharimonadia bacterium]
MSAPEPCPYLPMSGRMLTADSIHALGADRSEKFYFTAMEYAQVLWLAGFPAKALLLVNRSLSCWLPGVSYQAAVTHQPPFDGVEPCIAAPYHAKAWILHHRPEEGFIGNPRRHYQHLATRMVEPHKELRSWRAWACWYLAKESLPEHEYPDDAKQVREEGIIKPTRAQITDQLSRLSPADDLDAWRDALTLVHRWVGKAASPPAEVRFQLVGEDALPVVQKLAHEIWHQVYPTIISMEQIHYMLDLMYNLESMRREVRDRQVQYAMMIHDGESVGYIAWENKPASGATYLHKLYLKPGLHGHGIGSKALDWVTDRAREAGMRHLRLCVNRNNHPAIRAYRRAGFEFEEEVRTDIGGGFVMDDHVMGKGI